MTAGSDSHLHRRHAPAILFVLVTLALDILGFGLIIPILPRLIETFLGGDVSAATGVYGWLAALYSLMQFLFAPFLGVLSDRFGRRPVILGSLLGSAADYLLLAFAPSLLWFFIGRLIAGITGASISAASAYIADVSPPEKRAQNFGLIGAAFGLGFILGPALGGVLGHLGLRVPFFVAAGLTMVNALYGWYILPESLPPERRRPIRWNRANPIGSVLALRRHPVVLGLSGTLFLVHLGHAAIHSTWVLYTGYRFAWSTAQIGLSLAIVGIMAALVQGVLVRQIVPALGERRAIFTGLAISTATLAAYGLANRGWMIYVILVFGSLGGITGPAVQSLITRQVDPDEQGSVQGTLASLASLAGIAGPPAASHVFGFFIGPHAPCHVPGAAFFLGALFMLAGLALAARARFTGTPTPGKTEGAA
ncbi:MAG TPA: TCR/Tet family MFS transporter [Verrucomicrobiota bacterium]|nr:TCR/Tet family MFS transporter [Verrucomicrobiota bacterium]HNU49687.1 TCR/Tet family MFS transporter [Verrucomicrobiota bacterium]